MAPKRSPNASAAASTETKPARRPELVKRTSVPVVLIYRILASAHNHTRARNLWTHGKKQWKPVHEEAGYRILDLRLPKCTKVVFVVQSRTGHALEVFDSIPLHHGSTCLERMLAWLWKVECCTAKAQCLVYSRQPFRQISLWIWNVLR